MKDKTLAIKVLVFGGILTGLWIIWVGASFNFNKQLFVLLGFWAIFSAVGVYQSWGWARIALLIFSGIIFLMNLLWLYLACFNVWALMVLLFLSPVTGFCVYSTIVILRGRQGTLH